MPGKNIYYQGIYETRQYDVTVNSSVTSIDLSEGNVQNILLNADTTMYLDNPDEGSYFLIIEQGLAYDITWSPDIYWSGGVIPTITQTTGKKDIVHLSYTDGRFYATITQNY